MPAPNAEQYFHRGLAALAESRDTDAAELFFQAMRISGDDRLRRPDMRYLSYYGFSVAKSQGAVPAALEACRKAVQQEPHKPALLLNLGRVYLLAGRTDRALECLERGRRLAPAYAPIQRELARVDRRATPLLGLLDRSHAINRWAGRLRAGIQRRLQPTPRENPGPN